MKENAKTYITSKLKELLNSVPNIKVIYKNDSLSQEHLIKVLPKEQYEHNEDFHEFEENIIFDFIDNYPTESLVFLTDDEWIDVKIPDEIFVGQDFYTYKEQEVEVEIIDNNEEVTKFADNELFEFDSVNEDDIELSDDMFESFYGIFSNSVETITISNVIDEDFYGTEIIEEFCYFFKEKDLKEKNSANDSQYESSCEYNNYALAA
ncbi:hypothetical protein SAMN05444280_12313 [Tangfeifania diversioriginum]|uniref:Uncharacterized protein n=2 Tax=Tangfeifania diversioriginum TaxID=1168035 RepID=A0A1M6KE90_9BACT|nr:hypothetical protein SAMN05444280_12313 [Tangfeifania diversioriginum]